MPTDTPPVKDKTVQELFAETLVGEYDDEAAWEAVAELHSIGTSTVFQVAEEFSKSPDALKRARGMDVLAQLGVSLDNPSGMYLNERLAIVLAHLGDESDKVIGAAAWALAHMKSEKATAGLLTLRQSKNPRARHAVALGLSGETSPEAIDALIGLMQDAEGYIRHAATFSLGAEPAEGLPLDEPKIRDALRSRLDDDNEDVWLEAIRGLAIRKDPAGIQLLLEAFETETWGTSDLDAAAYLLKAEPDAPISELCEGLRSLLNQTTGKESP